MRLPLTFPRFLIAISFMLSGVIAQAQEKTITGTVTNPDGQPLAGTTVSVKGSTVATQTNADGNFTIQAPASAKSLTISSVGFETRMF